MSDFCDIKKYLRQSAVNRKALCDYQVWRVSLGSLCALLGPVVLKVAHSIAGVCGQEKPVFSWPATKRRKGMGVTVVPGSSKDPRTDH